MYINFSIYLGDIIDLKVIIYIHIWCRKWWI